MKSSFITKKSRIIIFVIVGGIFGLIVHLVWHSSTGINIFSVGPHVIKGIVHTSVGMIMGAIVYWLIPKR